MKYLIQYWLPNQSRLFSKPQQAELDGESALQNALAIARKNDYVVTAVYEVHPNTLGPITITLPDNIPGMVIEPPVLPEVVIPEDFDI